MVPHQARERHLVEDTRARSSMARYRAASMEDRHQTKLCVVREGITILLCKYNTLLRPTSTDHVSARSFQKDMSPLNLYKLQDWISQGRIDPSKPITVKELRQSRCVANVKDGVKLLAKGSETLTYPLNIIISRASKQAIAAIESAGGSVTTRYYTPFAVKKIMAGQMDPINSLQSQIPAGEATAGRTFCNRLPDPTGRKDIEYYRDSAHRGYLSYLVPEGQGPSLFYKTPGTSAVAMRKAPRGKKAAGENRIW